MNGLMPASTTFLFAFLSLAAMGMTPCQKLSEESFKKPIAPTFEPPKSVQVFDLDVKTGAEDPPAWLKAEWDSRLTFNQGKGVGLSGFYLAGGELLKNGDTNRTSVILVESTSSTDLLRHESLHAAYAAADPSQMRKRQLVEKRRSSNLEALVDAMQKVPKIDPDKLRSLTVTLVNTLWDLSSSTDIEEALVGCLMLESSQTVSANRQAHYEHAKKSLLVAVSPLQTIGRMLEKLPAKYASVQSLVTEKLSHMQLLNERLDELKP